MHILKGLLKSEWGLALAYFQGQTTWEAKYIAVCTSVEIEDGLKFNITDASL